MTMSLTVLGGSAASVGTGQGCAGYLVASESTRIMLDAGPGTLVELRRHTNFRTLDAVVISHLHVDHMLDTIALRFSLAYNPVKSGHRVPLWLPPRGIAFFDRLAAVFATDDAPEDFFRQVFELEEYNPDEPLLIGDLTLTFAPTVHFIDCWAIRVHPEHGGDLFYSADTGPAADLAALAAGTTVCAIEATTPEGKEGALPFARRGHLTATEAGAMAATAGTSTLVLTHMFEENDPGQSLAEASAVFTGEIVRAVPGATVRW
jgi:ribonuclease BN (tRNA processing enzyme)